MTDGERWLLIDDDETFLQVLSRSLLRQGVESVTAITGMMRSGLLKKATLTAAYWTSTWQVKAACNYCQSCCNTTTAWRCWC